MGESNDPVRLMEGVVQQGQGLKLLAWVELLGGGQLRRSSEIYQLQNQQP